MSGMGGSASSVVGVAQLIAFILIFCAGCKSPKLEFGIYAVPQERLQEVKELGFDFVVGPGEEGYLSAAERAGLKVVATGRRYPRHRAVMGHYLWDEPDLHLVGPDEVAAAYRRAKKASRKPNFLNLFSANSIEFYAKWGDALMFNWYPVGRLPVETYVSQIRSARLGSGRKPFFAVVQAFDWSHYPNLIRSRPTYRVPEPEEIKAMSVWAAMGGARGILYYPFDDGYFSIQDHPEIVQAIRDSIEFIRLYEPLLTGDRVWGPYPFRIISPDEDGDANSGSGVAIRFTRMDKRSRHLVLVAANTSSKPVIVEALPAVEMPITGALTFDPYEIKFFPVTIKPRQERPASP